MTDTHSGNPETEGKCGSGGWRTPYDSIPSASDLDASNHARFKKWFLARYNFPYNPNVDGELCHAWHAALSADAVAAEEQSHDAEIRRISDAIGIGQLATIEDIVKAIKALQQARDRFELMAKNPVVIVSEDCKECGQPMLPKGMTKKPDEYDHAQGCPVAAEEKARQETSGLCLKPTKYHLIAGASHYLCALVKGHEGECQPGGTCFTHGLYVGTTKCPQWPNCAALETPATCPTCFSPKPGERWCIAPRQDRPPHPANGLACVKCSAAFHKTAYRYVAIVIKVPADWPTKSETLEEAVAGVVKVNYSHVPGGIKITRIIPISEEIANKVWV